MSLPEAAAIYRARCATGPCYIIAFVLDGRPVVAIAPAQPTPLCIGLEAGLLRVVKAILSDLGVETPYITACRVASSLVGGSLRETLESIREAGLIISLERG